MVAVDPELAIAAAIVMAGGLLGTGIAQQGIGAAGMGIIAEKPEKFGQVLFFFVIPETLWYRRLRARYNLTTQHLLNEG